MGACEARTSVRAAGCDGVDEAGVVEEELREQPLRDLRGPAGVRNAGRDAVVNLLGAVPVPVAVCESMEYHDRRVLH